MCGEGCEGGCLFISLHDIIHVISVYNFQVIKPVYQTVKGKTIHNFKNLEWTWNLKTSFKSLKNARKFMCINIFGLLCM